MNGARRVLLPLSRPVPWLSPSYHTRTRKQQQALDDRRAQRPPHLTLIPRVGVHCTLLACCTDTTSVPCLLQQPPEGAFQQLLLDRDNTSTSTTIATATANATNRINTPASHPGSSTLASTDTIGDTAITNAPASGSGSSSGGGEGAEAAEAAIGSATATAATGGRRRARTAPTPSSAARAQTTKPDNARAKPAASSELDSTSSEATATSTAASALEAAQGEASGSTETITDATTSGSATATTTSDLVLQPALLHGTQLHHSGVVGLAMYPRVPGGAAVGAGGAAAGTGGGAGSGRASGGAGEGASSAGRLSAAAQATMAHVVLGSDLMHHVVLTVRGLSVGA